MDNKKIMDIDTLSIPTQILEELQKRQSRQTPITELTLPKADLVA